MELTAAAARTGQECLQWSSFTAWPLSITLAATPRTNPDGRLSTHGFSNPVPVKLALHTLLPSVKVRQGKKNAITIKAMTNLKADLWQHRSYFFLPSPWLLCKLALQTEVQVKRLPQFLGISNPSSKSTGTTPRALGCAIFNCDTQLIQKHSRPRPNYPCFDRSHLFNPIIKATKNVSGSGSMRGF